MRSTGGEQDDEDIDYGGDFPGDEPPDDDDGPEVALQVVGVHPTMAHTRSDSAANSGKSRVSSARSRRS